MNWRSARHALMCAGLLVNSVGMAGGAAAGPRVIQLGPGLDGAMTFVSATNVMIGRRSVMLTLYELKKPQGALSETAVLACDGSWITTAIDWRVAEDARTLDAVEIEAPNPVPLRMVEFKPTASTRWATAAKRAAALCRSARAEEAGLIIPIAFSVGETGTSSSLGVVTGRTSQAPDGLSVWVRQTPYTRTSVIDHHTQRGDAVETYRLTPSEAYSMNRFVFDCDARRGALREVAQYEKGNVRATTRAVSVDGDPLEVIVPNSVGDRVVEAVCRLYGTK